MVLSNTARMTPGCVPITTRRVAMKTASAMLWVTMRMVFTGEVLLV